MKESKENVAVVPLRADLPVGAKFRFEGRRNVYVVEKYDGAGMADCNLCALHKRRNKTLCASFFCTPSFRKDKVFVLVKKVK